MYLIIATIIFHVNVTSRVGLVVCNAGPLDDHTTANLVENFVPVFRVSVEQRESSCCKGLQW